MTRKINISIDDGLLSRADDYARNNYMSRSGTISIALNQFLLKKDYLFYVQSLAFYFEQIYLSDKLDDETLKKLSDLYKSFKLLIDGVL